MPTPSTPDRASLVRVPAITAWFWLVKILTTGAGESTSDYLGRNYPHAIVAGVGAVALVGSLVLQMRITGARRDLPCLAPERGHALHP